MSPYLSVFFSPDVGKFAKENDIRNCGCGCGGLRRKNIIIIIIKILTIVGVGAAGREVKISGQREGRAPHHLHDFLLLRMQASHYLPPTTPTPPPTPPS